MYANFQQFDEATGFSSKAGFKLTELQASDAALFAGWPVSLNRYEVGGGKTVVSTVVSLMRGDVQITFITVPPILIRPWVRWLNKVSSNVLQYEGNPRQRVALRKRIPECRWVVCSHAMFRKDYHHFLKETSHLRREIIVDEAQALKNVESVLFRIVQHLAVTDYTQLLTGTPTSQPDDCYAYIKLKNPKIYRDFGHFEMLHVDQKNHFKAVTEWRNLELLADNFALNSIKRTKEELHGYNIKPIYPDCAYALEPKHQALYEQLVEEQLLLLDDGTKIDATTAQRLYQACQQIVVNYDYFSGVETNRSMAYDLLDQTIESTDCLIKGRSKLIVWTIYQRTSRAILEYLRKRGIKCVGAFGGEKSQDSFDAFMEDEDTRILVAQPQSAGAGLNPQSVCWEMLFLETSTVPMYSRQCIGRVDRVGQLHIPNIRFGVAENTIQVRLLENLLLKDDLVSFVENTTASLRDVLLGRK